MKDRKGLAIFSLVTAFAFSMLLTIAGLIIFGVLMDGWFHTGSLFTILGGVLGVFAGIYNLIRQIIRLEEKDGKD